MKSLTLFLALLLISVEAHSADVNAKACLTRNEARALYPRAYLYWSGGSRGQRCWSNRRGRRHVVPGRAWIVQASVPPKEQEIEHIEPALMWQPQWSWVFEAVNSRAQAEEPFTTWPPGTEPDVWPSLENPPSNTPGTVLVVLCGIAAFMFGTALTRWHSRRIRISRVL